MLSSTYNKINCIKNLFITIPNNIKKNLSTTIKISLSLLCLYIAIKQINITTTYNLLKSSNYLWLALAFIVFTLSRIVASIRLNIFFTHIGLKICQIFNLKLYYLGMFYNLLLPGGISGDGYKIYLLQKNSSIKTKELIHAIFCDRLSGLFALIILLFYCIAFSHIAKTLSIHPNVFLLLSIAIIPLSYLVCYLVSKKFIKCFIQTSLWAAALQFTQGLSALFLLFALGNWYNNYDYLAIFFISSIVSVLPISIGGFGTRELTFVFFLQQLTLDKNIGIAMSLLFFLFQSISSLLGIFFININFNTQNLKSNNTN